jgi:antitoxin VapB
LQHFGNGVLLLPIDDPCSTMEAGFTSLEPGFVMELHEPPPFSRIV